MPVCEKMYNRSFVFGEMKKEGAVRVRAAELYSEEKGYGILPLSGEGQKPDRFTGTGGWYAGPSCAEAFAEKGIPRAQDRAYGLYAGAAGYPLIFRVKVPHKGVYAVTVTLRGGEDGCGRIDLYTNRRNLVKRGMKLGAGEVRQLSFYINVCEYIPVIGEPMRLDDTVYVAVLESHQSREEAEPGAVPEAGTAASAAEMASSAAPTGTAALAASLAVSTGTAALAEVEIREAAAPTVFLAGDSLVTDYDGQYPDNPLMNFGSWGQNLLSFLPGAAVCNQAHGGMTTNCFRDDGHFEIVRRNIRPGDIFMLQFGHNDQKRRNLKAYVQYAANLRWYIGQIRQRGAYPVIVTSLSRIPGRDEDGYYDLLQEYAESCLRVGRECHVPVIDLHEYSFRLMCEAGPDMCKDYFMDVTHTNDYGAMIAVRFIAGEIERQSIEPLRGLMEQERGSGAPECVQEQGSGVPECAQEQGEVRPDACKERPGFWKPDRRLRPAGTVSSVRKEEKPVLPHDLPELPYADCRHIRQQRELKEAMWKGLLDPCIRFFHPFDEIPRGQFLYLFFKAAPSPARRPYQGKYCDIYRYEWDASAVQAAVDGGLVDETTTPDARFRPDDALTGGELVSFMVRSLHEPGRRDISMQECERQARSLGLLWEAYERNGSVNRLDCTVALVHLMNLDREEIAALPE